MHSKAFRKEEVSLQNLLFLPKSNISIFDDCPMMEFKQLFTFVCCYFQRIRKLACFFVSFLLFCLFHSLHFSPIPSLYLFTFLSISFSLYLYTSSQFPLSISLSFSLILFVSFILSLQVLFLSFLCLAFFQFSHILFSWF